MATTKMTTTTHHQRRAGILLHPTSLPSGILDSDVERWLQLLADTGFSIWQVLPLGEPQSGLSPYQCSSAFAMNPMLLKEYPSLDQTDNMFVAFCEEQQFWLDDYVLFKILKQHFNDVAWVEWPAQWKNHTSLVLQTSNLQNKKEIVALKWQQYQLHKRWQEIREKASELNILLFGDMPIYVGYDSADVWAHPENFMLDADGNMQVVSGVPPDYFSETGQRWGNPHYNWDVMKADGFDWWQSRIQHHLAQFDLVRIDHFRGLEAAWVIDASCETAIDGHWQKMPGDELLSEIKAHIINKDEVDDESEQLPFVAEDLGIITPEVTELRKKFQLPGMSVLQFGFDEFDDNPHKPKNITEDTVVYTGTHDNDTSKGWFNSLEEHVKNHVIQALDLSAETEHDDIASIEMADRVVDKLIENAMKSDADTCIVPLQDYLHLDSDARMNIPGTITDNWQWQFQWQQLELLFDSNQKEKMRLLFTHSQRSVDPDCAS